MIKLDKDSFILDRPLHRSIYIRYIKLLGIDMEFYRAGKGETLSWHTQPDFSDKIKVNITHDGKLNRYTLKNTLERHLNYPNSYLKRAIIEGAFR